MGWMGSWRYAGVEPVRGIQTIPRTVELKTFPEGIRLVQAPTGKREARPVPARPAPDAAPPAGLSEIREDKLREAIARLASGIETRRAVEAA